ncbi:undecaprenyldiphospho-muramoylpentapeptide beta-N-acetylglucosaminyltransferase [Salinimonas marina]|uniref:UDP-N-acetylglucosamine--N-acetylmuramyl-(pentapeptide) pyrophosphoryl-undecaprenol N-acetylglucosamine transferase n=1 Tax=Salinimonas marina TaxID=2785918 RepID=A0A7S9DYQ5_9ALTE|nr:undecaprenyldiphospho-muramoylpentapeptide beta-N-acetylglucosaminyltransferase [Salinimonas marina]QPG06287.1 undecaprenyldiphospho-muramoylpentapeptide beta-N-acetylglucosaminyltransferase [Salinimonas marina]
MPTPKRCVIMAGGTGGHVFPALAVAIALRERGWDVQWLGTAERMEARVVPANQFDIHFLPVTGLRGKGLKVRLQGLLALGKSLWHARRLLQRLKPDLVVGFGGYASGPGGAAAYSLRIPLMIHEQNAAIGMTNKLLGRLAKKILLGFSAAQNQFGQVANRCVTVGNPIRQEIASLQPKVSTHTPLRVLIVGGSLGSAPLNAAIPDIAGRYPGLSVWHQSGKNQAQALEQAYAGAHCEWQVSEFIEQMHEAYAWADVIICRAGALTVSEVAAAGLTAVFVPLPHAVDDHQTKNAQALVNNEAAVLIPQQNLAAQLPGVIERWLADPGRCVAMGKNARQQAQLDATDNVINQCIALTGETADGV